MSKLKSELNSTDFGLRVPFNWRGKRQLITTFWWIDSIGFVHWISYQSKWYRFNPKTIRIFSTERGPMTAFFLTLSHHISMFTTSIVIVLCICFWCHCKTDRCVWISNIDFLVWISVLKLVSMNYRYTF